MNNTEIGTAAPNASAAQPVKKRTHKACPEVQHRTRSKVKIVKAVDKKPSKCKLTSLMEYLDSIKDQSFTGYIKVNFSQGNIGRVERFEEILRK